MAAGDAPGTAAAAPVAAAPTRHPLALLFRPQTVRARCRAVARSVEDGVSPHFRIDRSALPAIADRVAALTLRRFPDLKIPLHSRWRHFEAGGVDRRGELERAIAHLSPPERARARVDLTVVSVLLDAGAGARWRYTERRELPAAALPGAEADDLLAMLDRAGRTAAPAAPAAATLRDAEPAEAARPADGTGDPPSGAGRGAGGAEAAAPARADEADAGDGAGARAGNGTGTGADAAADMSAGAGRAPEPAAATTGAPADDAGGHVYTRSEGLGVASFRAFMAGAFSARRGEPWRADASVLRHVDAAALRGIFQAGPSNPIVGLDGRATLLSRLGQLLHDEAARTGLPARPGMLVDRLSQGGRRSRVGADEVLAEVLRSFAGAWPSGNRVQGLPAGDVWPHAWAGAAVDDGDAGGGHGRTAAVDRTTVGWVPFHKLSQWLTYSLIEPLGDSGLAVDGLDALTGLPEYRNGGLLIDGGAIVPRDPRRLQQTLRPGDDFVVEWRALTVVLLDELAPLIRQRLGLAADGLPLACLLEGGTWAAGREIAAEKRADGSPPVKIDSDGTVF